MGKRVLLADLDPQANSTISYLDVGQIESTVYDLLTDQSVTAEQCIRPSRVDGLAILPSRIALAKIESKLVGEFDAPFRLKDRLDPLRSTYDFIIVDTPPTLGLITVNAL